MHVHARDTSDFMLWLARGVTTIRILRGSPASLDWRRRSRDGFLLAPTIITSGPFTNLPLVRTPADAWRAAVEQKAAGYDEIKIHGSLEQETYDSLIAYGRRLNIPVVGHVPRNLAFASVLANRQADISHLEEILYGAFRTNLDDTSVAKIPAVSRSIAAGGITVTTTLVTYQRIAAQVRDLPPLLRDPANQYVAPSLLESWQPRNNEYLRNFTPNADWAPKLAARYAFLEKLVQGLHAARVRLLLGTDAVGPLWVPGFTVHDELRLLVRNGFTPFEALQSATTNPAAFLGQTGEFGTVSAGARADLILVDANPLTDVGNAERVAGVVRRDCPTAVVFDEGGINDVANALIARHRLADALPVLRFNADLFPQSYLAPFFLGEAVLAAGDTAGAIAAYRKSVANDEQMMDAIDRLKRLGAWPLR